MKTKMIDHYRTTENLQWREFVKYGLPWLTVIGLVVTCSQGIASSHPALTLLAVVALGLGIYLEGKKSIHVVTLVKVADLALVSIFFTLTIGNPVFAVIGIMLCVIFIMLVKLNT